MEIYYIRTPSPIYYFFLAHEDRVQALGSFGHSGFIPEVEAEDAAAIVALAAGILLKKFHSRFIPEEEAEDAAAIVALAARILSGEFPEVRRVPLGEDVLRAWASLLDEDEEVALDLAEAALEAAHRAKDLREAEAFLRESLKGLPAQEEGVA